MVIRIDVISKVINDGLSRTIKAPLWCFVVAGEGLVDDAVAVAVDEAVVNGVIDDGEVWAVLVLLPVVTVAVVVEDSDEVVVIVTVIFPAVVVPVVVAGAVVVVGDIVDVVTIVVIVVVGHGVGGVVVGVVVLVEVDVDVVSAVVVEVDVEVVSVVLVEVGVEVVISVQSALTTPVVELLHDSGNLFLQAGRQEESPHDSASVVPSRIGSQPFASQQ